MTSGRPVDRVATTCEKPPAAQNGIARKTTVSGTCSAKPAAMSLACVSSAAWLCSTNLGAFVVPDVVNITQPASALALSSVQGAQRVSSR